MKKLLSFAFVLIMVLACAAPVAAAPTEPGVVVLTPVTPVFPSDKGEVADESGLKIDDLEEKNNMVYLSKSLAEKIAKLLLKVNEVNTNILPVFTAAAAPSGFVAEVTFTMKGKDLLASFPQDINLIGMISATEGKLFVYENNPTNFDTGKFTLKKGGVVFTGEIDPDEDYQLVVFIKDGGEFDLDGIVNGKIICSIFIASEKKSTKDCCILDCFDGCNAGFGYLALILMGAAPFIFVKRR